MSPIRALRRPPVRFLLLALALCACRSPGTAARCPYLLPARCTGECVDVERPRPFTCTCPRSCPCWQRYDHPPPS